MELGLPSGTVKQLDLGTLGFWALMLKLTGIIPKGSQVLKHSSDLEVIVDADLASKYLPRASCPQAILKFRPLNSLDYRDHHELQ